MEVILLNRIGNFFSCRFEFSVVLFLNKIKFLFLESIKEGSVEINYDGKVSCNIIVLFEKLDFKRIYLFIN